MKKIFFLAFIAFGFSVAAAPKAKVPAVVLTAFQQKFPAITDVDWVKESDGGYEAEFEVGGKDMSATFGADGKWLETETEISGTEIPKLVAEAFASIGKTIAEASKIETPDGKTVYEIEYRSGLKMRELFFTATGEAVSL